MVNALQLQAQIAAAQAQLQSLLAQAAEQEEHAAMAPEPEVDAEAALARGEQATMLETIEQRLLSELPVEEQAAIEYDKPSISPSRLAAHQERKKQGYSQGEESYDDPDPTGEEYDSAFDGSADREGRSAFVPVEDAGEPPLAAHGSDIDSEESAEPAEEFDLAAAGYPMGDAEPEAPEEPDSAVLESLFLEAHGGPFDPNSSMDAGKMGDIKKLLASGQDFGDLAKDKKAQTRFALQLYRQ